MRIYLTDPISIESGDAVTGQERLPGWQGRTLLAMLLLNSHLPLSKGRIASEFWDEHPPAAWSGAIRLLIHKLRKSLGLIPELEIRSDDDGSYRLAASSEVWIDIVDAQCLLSRASAAYARKEFDPAYTASIAAMRIAERPFLPGISGGSWTAGERRRLEDTRVEAQTMIARVHLAKRRTSECVRAAEAVIALDPYNESAYRVLMHAWASRDEIGHAVKAYRQCEQVMNEDLDVAPSQMTRNLAHALMAGRWSADLMSADLDSGVGAM